MSSLEPTTSSNKDPISNAINMLSHLEDENDDDGGSTNRKKKRKSEKSHSPARSKSLPFSTSTPMVSKDKSKKRRSEVLSPGKPSKVGSTPVKEEQEEPKDLMQTPKAVLKPKPKSTPKSAKSSTSTPISSEGPAAPVPAKKKRKKRKRIVLV